MLAGRRRRQNGTSIWGAHSPGAVGYGGWAGVVVVLRVGECNAVKVVGLRAMDAKERSKTMFHLRLLHTLCLQPTSQPSPNVPAIH
jgi:hypothetical protein